MLAHDALAALEAIGKAHDTDDSVVEALVKDAMVDQAATYRDGIYYDCIIYYTDGSALREDYSQGDGGHWVALSDDDMAGSGWDTDTMRLRQYDMY